VTTCFASNGPNDSATPLGQRTSTRSARPAGLRLVAEGLPGRDYELFLRTPRRPLSSAALALSPAGPGEYRLTLRFDGPKGGHARREVTIPLR
jgi:hypothetical protein